MSRNQTNLALAGYDDIFNVGTPKDGERVQSLSLTELYAPDCHPFQVNNDEQMTLLVESVKQYGVREPGLARTRTDGGYELLCGNRRKRACELAGLTEMPVIVRELDDDLAIIAMVDSNLQQREAILPSEKAWAYRMKMNALNHNGVKGEQYSCDIMEEQMGESKAQIFRFIRLTELVESLLDMVDAKQLAFNPAVELSHLPYDKQHIIVDCIAKYEIRPSLSQTVKMKKMNKAGTLTAEIIDQILSETKGQAAPKSKEDKTIRKFKRFFPDDYTPLQIENVIISLLQNWSPATS